MAHPPATSAAERMREFLAAQREAYRAGLAQKLSLAQDLWRRAQGGHEEAAWRELERLAHSLHGSAATYGFRGIGEAAQALEEAVEACMRLHDVEAQAAQREVVARRLQALCDLLAAEAGGP